ncbi:unnamed protein product [Rotaria socialis]|uniref:NAD(P)(+)--arginine ADP-ribosyltransferase n=1 Tax=Rotaria socialis TaxID=392032 RepID=A0A817SAL9_9BILA|nr:unnamed protein product [Rotaria socialis]
MASASPVSNKSFINVQWVWNASPNPFSKSQNIEWRRYSDVENMIIEKAFTTGETNAILDDYHIDFKHSVQISNDDIHKQRPVKRTVCDKDDRILREERFLPNPVPPDRPFGGQYGFISPFIKEVVKDLNLTKKQLPSKDKTVVPMIVEKAASGIIEEGSEQHEQVWRSKIRTLGPFCLLLWDNPFNRKLTKPGTILYRGAKLSADLIALFKDDCPKDPRPWHSFQAFTSCTRNASVAENFGNVLFIMKICLAFTVDLTELSKYSYEEEELLFPGVSFTVDIMEFDKKKNKHLIYLTLQQRHDKAEQHHVYKNAPQPSYDPQTPPDTSAYISAALVLGEALGSGDPDAIAAAKAALDRVTADAHASGVFDHAAAFSGSVLDRVASIDDDYAVAGAADCDGHDDDWKKLDNANVLYSLSDIDNERFAILAQEKMFTKFLNFVLALADDIYLIPTSILDRFCSCILPRVHHNVKCLSLDLTSMERILRVAEYPYLSQLKLFNFNQDICSSYFTDLPSTTFSSSILTKLCISLNTLQDCLSLLDGRLKQLSTLIVIVHGTKNHSTFDHNMNDLPNLKCFSLTYNSIEAYGAQVIPLLRRMSHLKGLILYLSIENRVVFVDGTRLYNEILIHMPQLRTFTF